MECNMIKNGLRIVRGNAFILRIVVKAYRVDGSEVSGFVLDPTKDVLLLTTNNGVRAIPFTVEDSSTNHAIVSFGGGLQVGYYGLDFSGVFDGEDWRFAAKNVFSIVELTVQGNVPKDGIVYDDTYDVNAAVSLALLGPQADWSETDPTKQSYIKNKPTVYTKAEINVLLANKQDVINDLQTIRAGAAAGALAAPQATTYNKMEVDGLISDEEARAKAAEKANADAIDGIEEKIPSGASSSNKLVDNQMLTQGLGQKQDVINDLQTIRAGAAAGALAAPQATTYNKTEVNGLIGNEETRAKGAEQALQTAIDIINGKIPAQATAQNQLADKNFVNSSISTATADFKGTYNSLQDLEQVTANANDYAFVIATDAAGNTVYKRYKWVDGTGWTWEYDLNNSSFTAAQWAAIQSGITAALVTKLSDLPTNAELNQRISTAITTALGQYYTKTEIDTALAAINADITSAVGRVFFIEKSFGKYDGQREIVLQQAKSGKYVNTDGGETTASGYGISAPITLNAGDILLIPSAQAVPASVSVVARMVDRTYQKVIAYIYTYRTDYPELPATATADYDSTLAYTAVYDESGDTPVLTGWTRAGQTYTTLPATREVSEQFYEPLVRQAVSAMPSTGYYIYLSPTAMTVVISGLTATVSGGTALVVGWGIFKNITTNFVGAPGQSVLAQAFAVLFAAIDGLKAQLDNLGETKAVSIDFEEQPKMCGQDMHIVGSGAPASPVVPTMVGQEYLDVTNKKCYKAFSITNSVSDWVLLN